MFFTMLPPPLVVLLLTPGPVDIGSWSTAPTALLLNEVFLIAVIPIMASGLCVVGVLPGRFLPAVTVLEIPSP